MANKFKFNPKYNESSSLFRHNWAIDVTDANTPPYTSLNSGTTARDQWNLLVLTRDGNEARWYVNGTHTATRTHGYGSLTTTNAAVRIGRGYAGLWIGDMKQVQAWNRALSQQEIQQLKAWQS